MDALLIPPDLETEYGTSGPIWLDKSGIIVALNKGEKEHTLENAKENIIVSRIFFWRYIIFRKLFPDR